MSQWKRRLRPWWPAIAYMALITWLSSRPQVLVHLPDVPWQDKVAHTLEYAGLGVLMARAIAQSVAKPRFWTIAMRAVVLTTLWGYLDEIHQAFVPGRTPDRLDLLADLVGAILGVMLYAAGRRAVRAMRRARANATRSHA